MSAVYFKFTHTLRAQMAAMIYVDIIQVMDLILLTSIVDNRREIERIKQEIKSGTRAREYN